MAIMNNGENSIHKQGARDLLTLLFPEDTVVFEKDKILLQKENFTSVIQEENFDEFQNIIREMFFSGLDEEQKSYDPADKQASKIAEKIKKGKSKAAKSKGSENDDFEFYSQYASILAVGLKKDINELMNYTVYQIKSEFKRFQAKNASDFYLKARLAGAQDLEEVKDWMSEIHP
jgi:hypothetical protein